MYPELSETNPNDKGHEMIGTLDIEEAATKAAANWRGFDSFVWWRQREMDDADRWTIVYATNRDSTLIAESNASVIAKALTPFMEGDDATVVAEQHSHWLVGHVNGYSIQVYDGNGNITEAFRTYFELLEQMDDYPILDESDYSDREYAATLENIDLASWSLKRKYALPEGWESDVYSWLSDHRSGEIQNRDDLGGWPDEESLKAAFAALGFQPAE